MESKQKQRRRLKVFQIFTITTIFFGIVTIFSLFLLSVVYVLIQTEVITFINPNQIYVPEGSSLHDLHLFTFRNRSLYRYDAQYIVLENDEEFEPVAAKEDITEDVRVLTTTKYDENYKFDFKCEGTCKCVESEEFRDRRLANVVYTHRYAAMVVVSFLGYATAKFVNDNIDECFMAAKDALGDDVPIECSIDEERCDMVDKKDPVKNRVFKCRGHCLTANFEDKIKAEAAAASECEDNWALSHIIQIQPPDGRCFPDECRNLARKEYIRKWLLPYCKGIFDVYNKPVSIFRTRKEEILPCIGTKPGVPMDSHVVCDDPLDSQMQLDGD